MGMKQEKTYRDIGQRVDALVGARGQSTVDDKAVRLIPAVRKVLTGGETGDVSSGNTDAILLDLIALYNK